MNFEAGDAVVHPVRGAGVVTKVQERKLHGRIDTYYTIKLLGHNPSKLMIPVETAIQLGVRHAVSKSDLERLWDVILSEPEDLPDPYKARYKVLRERLETGDVFQIAEVIRDMAWRQHEEGRLNVKGKRMYEKAIKLVAGEMAAIKDIDFETSELQIRAKLAEQIAPTATA